ncbi:MAG: SLC26A/SulP transporter family protein [Hyphomicrobiales bacterium]|nr:SLC26A/SulP transporter family protein [Hyphomicrobiales bacterium]
MEPKAETEPNRLPPLHLGNGLIAGVICGFLAVVQSTGFGMLLLVGEEQSLVSVAVGMALFSTAVVAALAAMTSSIPGVVSIAQGVSIAAIAGPIVSVIMTMGREAASEVLAATVVVSVAATTMAIGIAAFLLGRLKLGRFVRFVPFPVIGGFLAGTGWLILLGGLGIVAGHTLTLADHAMLLQPDALLRFAAMLGFLIPFILLQQRFSVALLFPVMALAAIILFNIVVLATDLDRATLRTQGWLVAISGGSPLWPPISPASITSVDLSAIAGQLLSLPTVVVLTVIAVLMNATGIELDSRRDVDLDRELRSVGLQNLVAGLGGGVPGFQSMSLTSLSGRLHAPTPVVGLTVSGCCIAALAFGGLILSLVPTPLLGALLIWIGAQFLVQWLGRAYTRVSRLEYAVIILIFAVIVGVSFAWGILVGLIAAAILFVVEYGRVEIVRHVMTGQDYQSGNDTSEERRAILRATGDAILIVRLQGFLFFGTADGLRKRIERRIEDHAGTPIRYLIVDFHRVSGLDSSTVVSFTRLAQVAATGGFVLVFSGASDDVRAALIRGGSEDGSDTIARFEGDLDNALEWCENDLLNEVAPQIVGAASVPVIDLLVDIVKDRTLAETLLGYLDRVELEPGAVLIPQHARSDDVFFIEKGRAAVELSGNGREAVRIATVGRGSIVGEIAFYLNKPRSASVLAETPLVAWRFSADGFERLCKASPEAAIAFHRGMAGMLANRLTATNRLVGLLAD